MLHLGRRPTSIWSAPTIRLQIALHPWPDAGRTDGLDQPALALSAPSVEVEDDGLLTMQEILRLLDADCRCQPAIQERGRRGAEAASGSGARFYAGHARFGDELVRSLASARTVSVFRRQAANPR